VAWSFKGSTGCNEAGWIIDEYIRLKNLSKIGFRFNPDEFPTYLLDCLSLIANEIAKLESDEMRRKRR